MDYEEGTLHEMGIKKKDIESVCIPCSLDADIINNIKALQEEFMPDLVFIEAEETVLPVRIKADLQRMMMESMQIAPMITMVDAKEFPPGDLNVVEICKDPGRRNGYHLSEQSGYGR